MLIAVLFIYRGVTKRNSWCSKTKIPSKINERRINRIERMTSNNTTGGINEVTPEPPFVWYWALRGVLCFLSVSGNGSIIYLISTRTRLQNTTNWLTLSLAVADFLIGAAVIPSSFVCYFLIWCDWYAINRIFKYLFFVSIANLCILTIDRYMAVIYPFKYYLLKRNKTRLRLVSGGWLIPAIIALIPFSWENFSKDKYDSAWQVFLAIETVVLIVLPCALMLIAYGRIWRVTHRQARAIESHDQDIYRSRERKTFTRVRREGRSSLRVYGLLVVLFVACWSLSGYRYVCTAFRLRRISDIVTALSRLLMLCNSAVNFLVYACFKRDIQLEIKKCLQGIVLWQVNQVNEIPSNYPAESVT